jgi:hypothetical protein
MTDYTQMTDLQLEVREAEARETMAKAYAERVAIIRERERRAAAGKACAACGKAYGQPHQDGCPALSGYATVASPEAPDASRISWEGTGAGGEPIKVIDRSELPPDETWPPTAEQITKAIHEAEERNAGK